MLCWVLHFPEPSDEAVSQSERVAPPRKAVKPEMRQKARRSRRGLVTGRKQRKATAPMIRPAGKSEQETDGGSEGQAKKRPDDKNEEAAHQSPRSATLHTLMSVIRPTTPQKKLFVRQGQISTAGRGRAWRRCSRTSEVLSGADSASDAECAWSAGAAMRHQKGHLAD